MPYHAELPGEAPAFGLEEEKGVRGNPSPVFTGVSSGNARQGRAHGSGLVMLGNSSGLRAASVISICWVPGSGVM